MSVLVVHGDARAIPLGDQSVHCVISSPPYWGLRDYGVAGQLGLEKTPELYVQNLVEILREVKRVLREDGTLWLNLGDSYNNRSVARPSSHQGGLGFTNESIERTWAAGTALGLTRLSLSSSGMKEKDLVGIPWLVAFALRADGWYLRSDIIWSKPNPMPESVTDRPTRSHEYLFLLTKSAKYYYDYEGVKEAANQTGKGNARSFCGGGAYTKGQSRVNSRQVPRESHGNTLVVSGTRNRRSVWTITTKPFRGAHFATFPPDLVEPCLLAGTSPQVCAGCGAPYRRVIEKGPALIDQQIACGGAADGSYSGVAQKDYASAAAQDPSATKARILAGMRERRTLGWTPTCACPDGWCPAVVLDPFGGAGTVGVVATRHDRDAVLVELKAEYCQMSQARQRGNAATRQRGSERERENHREQTSRTLAPSRGVQ